MPTLTASSRPARTARRRAAAALRRAADHLDTRATSAAGPAPVSPLAHGEHPSYGQDTPVRATHRFVAARRKLDTGDWVGLSSTALIMLASDQAAYELRDEASCVGDLRRRLPRDYSDLDRCEQTYRLAPPHLRARMLPHLERFRAAVEASRGPRRRAVAPLQSATAEHFGVSA